MIKIETNTGSYEVKSLDELNEILEKCSLNEYNDFCIYGHGESSLTVLTNSEKGFLMYLREKDDTGLCSLTTGTNGGYENFMLSNGQMDEYPTENLVDKISAMGAIREYYLSGKMLDNLTWIES